MGDVLNSVSSTLTNIIGWLIQKIFESLMAPFADIYSVDELIFGQFDTEEEIYWNTFTATELANGFLPSYYLMMTVAGTMLVLFIIFAGMRVAGASVNANKRNELIEFTKELVLVGMGLYLLPQFYNLLFGINEMFLNLFSGALGTDIFNIELEDSTELSADNSLFIGNLVIEFILFGVGIWANFYYLMRKITLLILLPLGPVMLVCWMFPAWKGVTLNYLKELTGTIFIQSIHAFTFFTVAIVSNAQTGIIATIIGYMIFIPISEQIRNLFGLSTNTVGMLNRAGAMMGMAALAGVAGSVKGALSGESVMGALKNIKDGGKKISDGFKDGKGMDALKDVAGNAKEAAFASAKSMDMEKFGDLVSNGGKAVGGIAGTFMGSPMGPIATLAAAEVMGKAGDVTGGLVGRTSHAAITKARQMTKDGLSNVQDMQAQQAANYADEKMVNSLADNAAAAWAGESKAQVMQGLREKFPSATQPDLDKKFNDIVAAKKQEFTKDAAALWSSAKTSASGRGDAEQLINSASEAMGEQWAASNEKAFVDQWKASNPRGENESEQAYNSRSAQAFNDEKARMTDNFKKDGHVFARDNADFNGDVNRTELADFMASAGMQHKGIGNVTSNALANAANSNMEHVLGTDLMNGGVPNVDAIVSNLANAKTQASKAAFLSEQSAKGVSGEQAQQMWRAKENDVYNENVASFSNPAFTDAISKPFSVPSTSRLVGAGQTAAAFVEGAVSKDIAAVQTGLDLIKTAVNTGASTYQASVATGTGLLGATTSAISAAKLQTSQQMIENFGGDAVQAQQSIVQGAGYAAGVLLGSSGRVMAQNAALSVIGRTPMANAIQSQISSASEIIQMAQQVPNDDGGMSIAAGAIRQVTTRDKSYIEVRTNSGEIRTVSRIGAGSESLQPGETVYQDLTSHDGKTLEIAPIGRSGVSTYRMDTGNGRIPVSHDVQNPMSLIGNTGASNYDANQNYRMTQPLNQQIDSGKFYQEDLAKAVNAKQVTDVQVITTKAEQFLVGKNAEGQQVRLSPITQGDARLGANEVLNTPVTISSRGEIYAANVIADANTGAVQGIESKMTRNQQVRGNATVTETISTPNGGHNTRQSIQRNVVITENGSPEVQVTKITEVTGVATPEQAYRGYPRDLASEGTTQYTNLLKSRHAERAARGVAKRRAVDEVRKKQGTL